MAKIDDLPSISQLYDLIDAVPRYPVSAAELTLLAKRKGADHTVVDFYRAFPPNIYFDDAEDLAVRSEQVEILNYEHDQQPVEQIRSSEG